MNKPEYISFKDWDILNSKYSSKELEEYFNKNYPYQYLIGDVLFCDNKILVDKRVLIPRFETEIMTIDVINYIKSLNKDNLKVADLCTGSGCIAISIKKECNVNIDAIDISDDALSLAKENSKLNEADINFIKRDIINDYNNYEYDIIVSNPPYVRLDENVGESTKYEPQIALYANNNGLEFYEQILNKYKAKYYAFEIGSMQKDEVINIVKSYYPQANIISKKDYSGFDRFIYVTNE